jgi:hypothetical protein
MVRRRRVVRIEIFARIERTRRKRKRRRRVERAGCVGRREGRGRRTRALLCKFLDEVGVLKNLVCVDGCKFL